MSGFVDVRDDPDRPEGGHALVHFRDAHGPTGRRILDIEPLTEGYLYSGPREVEVEVSAERGGLLLRVGDGALDELVPGIAVRLSIEGSDVEAETLWPSLTPRARIPTRRASMSAGRKRQVVEVTSGRSLRSPPKRDVALDGADRDQRADGRVSGSGEPTDGVSSQDESLLNAKAKGPDPTDQTLQGASTDRRRAVGDQSTAEQATDVVVDPELPLKRKGWPTTVLAVTAAVAFGLGLAIPFAFKLNQDKPSPKPEQPSQTDLSLPSPYAFLANLPSVSPNGARVEGLDWKAFLTRSRSAKSTKEKSFWRKWAIRTVLENRADGAATSLMDFATDLAETNKDEGTLASSRLLWELAAVAGECKAMSNIAKALTKPENNAEQKTWSDRARRCLSGTPRP